MTYKIKTYSYALIILSFFQIQCGSSGPSKITVDQLMGQYTLVDSVCNGVSIPTKGIVETLFMNSGSGRFTDTAGGCSVSQDFEYRIEQENIYMIAGSYECDCDLAFTYNAQAQVFFCPEDYPLIATARRQVRFDGDHLLLTLENGVCTLDYLRF